MDRWRKAYESLGFRGLDHRSIRFPVYGVTAAFWIQVAVWLLLRKELIPGFDGVWGWLVLSLMAAPGNIRALFFIALGPDRQGDWKSAREDPAQTEAPTSPVRQDTWTAPEIPGDTAPMNQPVPVGRRKSPGSVLLKVLVGATLIAACGGYWLTGGTIVGPSDSATDPPRLRNQVEKRYMLKLINQARVRNGVPQVVMGTNNVAQVQADQLLQDCVMSHWGTDGLKPYMRYSLAGGYQTNGENVLTFNECGLADTWLQWNDEPEEMIRESVEGWLESPGHRETMLNPEYRKVNIGLAWDRNVFKAIQHFEGDYVEYATLPVIEDGVLELDGKLGRGYTFAGPVPLMALIVYDPRPRRLTGGQLARTYCYGHGDYKEGLIPSFLLLQEEVELTLTLEQPQCIDPYHVGRGAGAPESQEESLRVFEESREQSLRLRETELTMNFRKAREMTAEGSEFSLIADVSELLDEQGPGVYTVVLVAQLEDSPEEQDTVISEYSIFHEVRPPRSYNRE